MASKNNKQTRRNRVSEARRIEREHATKKEAKRIRNEQKALTKGDDANEMNVASSIDDTRGGGDEKSGARRRTARGRSGTRTTTTLRPIGGVAKRVDGRRTRKVVRGVHVGNKRLRKNSVVYGVKIVDAASKAAALEAIAEAAGRGAAAMRE